MTRAARYAVGVAAVRPLNLRALLALVALVAGCGGEADKPAPRLGREPPRRVIEPPRGDLRALPPHEITADGIGPYRLAMPMAKILSALPSGPRIALLQIPGVVDHSAVHDDGLIIGGERQGDASFVAALRPGIARTAGGVEVGGALTEAAAAFGPELVEPDVARDPRLWVGATMPGARLIVEDQRIAAVVVAAPSAARPRAKPAPTPACARPPLPRTLGVPSVARGACLEGADAVAAIGDTVVALATGDGKVRKIAGIDLPGLRWVAPLAADGKDELVAVLDRRTADARVVSIVALALEGGRLVRLGDLDAYRLTENNAAWIGARLADLDLRLEVTREGDTLTVGGLLVNGRAPVADLGPLLPVQLRLHRRAPDDRDRGRVDAGVSDAEAERHDADEPLPE